MYIVTMRERVSKFVRKWK